MIDRFNGLYVALDRDIRDDDAKAIIDAIRMVKGVNDVTGHVVDMDSYVAQQRIKNELWTKLRDAFFGKEPN